MSLDLNDDALMLLQEGSLSLKGEFMWGSNYTFLLQVEHPLGEVSAVYKPTRGVRPLWDFSSQSLARREVAAFQVSQALGWQLVPPTVFRKDSPYGPGSVQLYIEHDPQYHYFNFSQSDKQRLRPTSLFDLLINNADRKGSHILLDPDSHLWLIDHGICFHTENKLRTVIWDFAGEPIPPDLCDDLTSFHQRLNTNADGDTALANSLAKYLTAAEVSALARRAGQIVKSGYYPNPDPDRRPYPWPPV